MDLDGNTGRQHYIGFFFSEKAPRGSLLASWPENPEENIERLKNAGLPVDTKIPKCSNCEGKILISHELALANAQS